MTALVTTSIELLSGAPNGIEKIRVLFRRLALEGKFSTFDCSSSPGAAWLHSTFGRVFSLEYGSNLPAPKRTGTGEFLVYGSNGVVGSHNACCVDAPCLVVGRKGSAGAVNVCEQPGCWVTDVAYFCVPPNSVTLRFAHLLFLTLGLDELGKGIKPGLSRSEAYALPVSIPPLAEQHRIVAKFDELMALCDRLEARQKDAEAAHARLVQALLDSLNQARDADEFQACWQRVVAQFSVLFTTPASIDSLWSAVLCLAAEGKLVAAGEQVAQLPIGELLLGDTLNGCSYKPSDTPVGIPILRISAGTGSDDFIVDETDHKWVEVTAAEREKFRLLRNDLLACRFNGNLHYVGAFALYNGASSVEQIFPDKLIRFRINDQRALPAYLRFVMNALPARQQIESFCATTVGNIGISATNLKTVKVRVPSLDEQHRIVAKVTELLALCGQLKASITAARAKHSKLADALVAQAIL
ncbi:hypothetical protein [Ideonella margarita]|uniref:Type I restriction enzyme S subunit n=1 Tax=Ideonella margarita TaxID=2984191 RepID=A0ABU9CB33_9BURK